MCKNTHTKLFRLQFSGASGNKSQWLSSVRDPLQMLGTCLLVSMSGEEARIEVSASNKALLHICQKLGLKVMNQTEQTIQMAKP